jgi:hypothetical protein
VFGTSSQATPGATHTAAKKLKHYRVNVARHSDDCAHVPVSHATIKRLSWPGQTLQSPFARLLNDRWVEHDDAIMLGKRSCHVLRLNGTMGSAAPPQGPHDIATVTPDQACDHHRRRESRG